MAFEGPMPEGVGEKDMLSKAWGWFKAYRTIQHPVRKQQLFLCYLSVPQGTRLLTQADIAGQASFEWTPARFHPTGQCLSFLTLPKALQRLKAADATRKQR